MGSNTEDTSFSKSASHVPSVEMVHVKCMVEGVESVEESLGCMRMVNCHG